MGGRMKDWFRRRVRGWRWRNLYPVLLPHVRLGRDGWSTIEGARQGIDPRAIEAMRMADGTRTARQVARGQGVSSAALVDARDDHLLTLWHSPVAESTGSQPVRSIVLSPHPDDAALSCGGAMIRDQRSLGSTGCVVVNFFTRLGWWRLGLEPDADRVTKVRQAEETLVGRLLRTKVRMLGLPEAPLRGHPAGSVFVTDADQRDRAVEEGIESEISRLVDEYAGPTTWKLPLGVGGHLDHRLLRDTARRVLHRRGVPASRVTFYEEQPYAAEQGGINDYSGLIDGVRLQPRDLNVADSIFWKLELCRAYWSQLDWPRIKRLEAYARRLGGGVAMERAWVEKPAV